MVSFLKMLPFVVFATVLVLFLIPLLTGKQQTVKSPNEHGNTLGNQPAERYKIGSIKIISLTTWCLNGFFFKDITFCCFIENTPNYQNTAINAAMGLYDDGKTGGTLNSWGQYAKSGDIIFDVAGGGLGGSVVSFFHPFSVCNSFLGYFQIQINLLSIKIISLTTWRLNSFFFKDVTFCCFCNKSSTNRTAPFTTKRKWTNI
jgi:hypothetical protein